MIAVRIARPQSGPLRSVSIMLALVALALMPAGVTGASDDPSAPGGPGSGAAGAFAPAHAAAAPAAEDGSDTAVLWRGFRHAWSYNHRLNRLGSWVEMTDCDGDYCRYSVRHSGASGSGEDKAVVRDAYTELSARGVGFRSDRVRIDVDGMEKTPDNGGGADEIIRGDEHVEIPLDGDWSDYEEFGVVLNGFDMMSQGRSAKVITLDLWVTEPRRESDKLVFEVGYEVLMDCDSFECKGQVAVPKFMDKSSGGGAFEPRGGKARQEVDYRLDVHYLAMGGESGALAVQRVSGVRNRYDWKPCRNNKVENPFTDVQEDDNWKGNFFPGNRMNCERSEGRELDHRDYRHDKPLPASGDYSVTTVGMTGLSVRLRHEAHFTQFDAVVGGSRTGDGYRLVALPFFKEWSSRPGLNSDAKFSYGFAGEAQARLSPALVQVRDGCKRSFVNAGGIHWKGGGQQPDTAAAVVGENREYAFRFGDQWSGTGGQGNLCEADREATVRHRSASADDPAFAVKQNGKTIWREFQRTERVEDPTRLRAGASDRYYSHAQPNQPGPPLEVAEPEPVGPDEVATTRTIGGRVYEEDSDHTISRAEVVFERRDGEVTESATSSTDGSYSVEVPPGRYDVRVDQRLYHPEETLVVVREEGGNTTANFFLEVDEEAVEAAERTAEAVEPGPEPAPELEPLPGEIPGTSVEDVAGMELDAAADFSGTWETDYGELRLHQVRGHLIGDYADQGIILGKVQGSCVAGVFTNGARNGVFRFRMPSDGALKGQWAWHGQSLETSWNGERVAEEPPTRLHNFTRGDGTTQVIDNDRTVYDGTYDSDHGSVELLSRDLLLVGDYGDRGILAGMWDGDSFVGRFTDEGRTGWFDLEFLSRNGTFRDGSRGWIGESGSRSWSLEKIDGETPPIDNALDDVSCSGG